MKDLLFKNKYNVEVVSRTPLIVRPNPKLRQGLRAEPTELDRSNVNDAHLLITDGADTTTVGIKGFEAGEIMTFKGATVLYELQMVITEFVHKALI